MSVNTYLIPYDFTSVATCAVNHAIKLIQLVGGKISLLHVVAKEDQESEMQAKLNDIAKEIKSNHNIDCNAIISKGTIFEDIAKISKDIQANLVIMGTHGLKGMQFITGSNALKVITKSLVPFIVVQEKNPNENYQKIVCPLDLKKETKQKVRLVARMAINLKAKVFIVVPKVNDEFLINDINRNLGYTEATFEANGIEYEVNTLDGSFAKKVVSYSESIAADLIAIVNDDDGQMPGFIGGDEQGMITNHAQIPVLVINSAQKTFGNGVLNN